MVSLAVEEVDKGTGRLSGAGKFGARLAGGRRPEEAGAAWERLHNLCIGSRRFLVRACGYEKQPFVRESG